VPRSGPLARRDHARAARHLSDLKHVRTSLASSPVQPVVALQDVCEMLSPVLLQHMPATRGHNPWQNDFRALPTASTT